MSPGLSSADPRSGQGGAVQLSALRPPNSFLVAERGPPKASRRLVISPDHRLQAPVAADPRVRPSSHRRLPLVSRT